MKEEVKKTKNVMKTVKILTIILLIILVSMIGFVGIYSQNKNQITNKLKDYKYSMELNGYRNIKLVLDTENKEIIKDSEGNIIEDVTDDEIKEKGYIKEEVANNAEEDKNIENYKNAKKIIEKRLKKLQAEEYKISLNEEDGTFNIEVPENSNTDKIVGQINTIGKFEIIDSESKEVLLSNNDIKSSSVLYNTTSSGTAVYLEIEFDKNGKSKLEEISRKYVKEETSTENVTDNENKTETEGATDEGTKETEKKITMKIDDQEIMSTSFDEPLTTGKLQLSVGTASTDESTLEDYVTQAQNVATVLDSGKLPLKYNVEKNQYILSDITKNDLKCVVYAFVTIVVTFVVILTFKYKLKGLISGLSIVGFAAIYMLLIRYTNVLISIESMIGILVTSILEYIFVSILLKNINNNIKENKENVVKKSMAQTYMKFFDRIVPICVMVITFSFIKWIPISSFGMITFWGLALIAIYNTVITKILLKILLEEK